MTNIDQFREHAHTFVDWMADYLESVAQFPVKSQVRPGEILSLIPEVPPEEADPVDRIFKDFKRDVIPGMTHWQSPNFFAYFPANSSYPSVLAEMLTATLGAQCMIWETSPAAAEMEEAMMNWLKKMTGIPEAFHGVIQDTASTATLTALLTAREKASGFSINKTGFSTQKFRIYCSTETHSSVEKAVKIAGFGKENMVKVPVDEFFRMDPIALEKAIIHDRQSGKEPLFIAATLGTTGSTAIDPLEQIVPLANKYKLWLHVDAALAGSALVLEEYRWMIRGIEGVDSFVFNPHKWMFTNFDCSAYFVKDKQALLQTFSIHPEYLKTKTSGAVNDYRDWGIPLGRRFRALKLWFVIRSFGTEGIRKKIKEHISIAAELEQWILDSEDFEMVTPRTLNLVCFRFKPGTESDEGILNRMNETLLQNLNASGKLYLSHTKLNGVYTLRMVTGQTYVTLDHVKQAWAFIKQTADRI